MSEDSPRYHVDRTPPDPEWPALWVALYQQHVACLNAPKPHPRAWSSRSPADTMRRYRTLVRDLLLFAEERGRAPVDRYRLEQLARPLLDPGNYIHAEEFLDAAQAAHTGPVLALKVKGLKRVVIDDGTGGSLRVQWFHRLTLRLARMTPHAFRFHNSRMFVLLTAPDEAVSIVQQLSHFLAGLVEPYLGHPSLRQGPPRLVHAVGRTWQEAMLVTKGALRQEQVPIRDLAL